MCCFEKVICLKTGLIIKRIRKEVDLKSILISVLSHPLLLTY